jgi:hypothetical protein
MPSSSSPTEALIPLFQGVRQALLAQPFALSPFLPIFHGVTISEGSDTPKSTVQGSDLELAALLTFFRDAFPRPNVSSPGLWHYVAHPPMIDLTMITIHGRLARALSQPQNLRNLCQLRFIVVVIILHQLGHAVATRFHKGTLSIKDDAFPYHISCHAPPVIRFPEQGFSVEEALFGGIVGVVFDDELDGLPPMFFRSDFTRISHLFLHCRNGLTYRLGMQSLCLALLGHRLNWYQIQLIWKRG